VAAIYLYSLNQGLPQHEVRALAFFSLVFTIMGLIFVNRSFSASLRSAFTRKNAAIPYVLILVPAMLAVTLFVPAVNQLFGFGQLHWQDITIAVGAGFLTLFILEAMKAFFFKSSRRPIHFLSK
jgi:Ca2+-transporting ATPase